MSLSRQQTIQAISKAFEKFQDLTVYLFGSSARGDFRDNSDIDLLILLPDYLSSKERVEMESEICGLLLPIEMETDLEISPVMLPEKVWKERKTPFTVNVMNDSIPL